MSWLLQNIHWVVCFGALIVALGELLERQERVGQLSRRAKYRPFVVFFGVVVTVFGSLFAAINQEKENQRVYSVITGGDSFCYVMLTPASKEPNSLLGLVVSSGTFPVYDVSLDIVDLNKSVNPSSFEEIIKNRTEISIGNLAPSMSSTIGIWHPSNTGFQNYRIFISQRNGYFIQDLQLRLLNGQWKIATRVAKGLPPNGKVVFEKVDSDFPRNSKGKVDWPL